MHTTKNLTLTFPNWFVDKDLQRHFMRGYFDGDGSIGIYPIKNRGILTKSSYYSNWVCTSTYNFCMDYRDIVRQATGINIGYNQTYDNGITTNIITSGRHQVIKIMDWLYKDATIYLERKHNKYLSMKTMEYSQFKAFWF